MANNLTTQVRGFAQISAAATDGDFSRFITVEASGEMDSLKTQINQMVFNLRDSIQKNTAAREAAELANRSKSEFLANMSHEIRYVASPWSALAVLIDSFWQNADERYHRYDRVDIRQRPEPLAARESGLSPQLGAVVITDYRRHLGYLEEYVAAYRFAFQY